MRRAWIGGLAGAMMILSVPTAAQAAGVPLFHDVWKLPLDTVIWEPLGTSNNWRTINVEYKSPCPVPAVFVGSGVDGGPWNGHAGWYKQQDGKCAGSAMGQGTLTALNINALQLCTTDPFGVSGRVCQVWQRRDPVTPQIHVVLPTTPPPKPSFYTMVFDHNGVPHFVPANANGAVSVSTGWYGDTALLAAEAMTGGKPAEKLFARSAPCRKPMDQLVGSQAKTVAISLTAAAHGDSTRAQRNNMATNLDRQATLAPALGRCLAGHGYRGGVTNKDAGKAEKNVSNGSLPKYVLSAFRRAGASPGFLDVVRFGLRQATASQLKGTLAARLKSRTGAQQLRALAASLRH